MSNRIERTATNALFNYAFQLSTMFVGVLARYFFIIYLGKDYLGVNSLFSNVLGILAISELGIGTAFGYALYKPLANNDKEIIKSIMVLFKKLYFIIGGFIFFMGILMIPLLPYIINNTTGLKNITIYYVVFLVDTCLGYFVSYNTILLLSDQKEYKLKKIQIAFTFLIAIAQTLTLVITKNYLWYLITGVIVRFCTHLCNRYVANKEYPYIVKEPSKKISSDDLNPIKKNIKALLVHKIAEAGVYQTDNIIISSFINLEMTGIVSNYTLISKYAETLLTILLSSAIPSIGNYIETENSVTRYDFYKKYRLLSYWLHGWVSLGFVFLSTPVIELILGNDYSINNYAVVFMGLILFIKGEGTPMFNYKVAAGMYDDDKKYALWGTVINLVVSIVAVNIIGVSGVFFGTLIFGIYSVTTRCYVVYKKAFNCKWSNILNGSIKYILYYIISACICLVCVNLVNMSPLFNLLIKLLILIIVPNLVFVAMEFKTVEFKFYINMIVKFLAKLRGR